MPPIRVGAPPYLVARPLTLGLEDEPGMELVREVPARLVEGLRSGALDVALVSSIELFRKPGYGYLEGPAVAGRGFVASVQVFLRRPLEAVRTVVLDPASRAAQALTRVVLPARLGGEPEFVEVPPGTDPHAACERGAGDAWLRIGDGALREFLATDAPQVFNPCEAWTEDTGLPFVFATWIVRPGVALDERMRAAFAAARARGTARIDALAREASEAWSLPFERCREYLGEECRYDEDASLRASLLEFRDRAAGRGLCDGSLEPEGLALPEATEPCR